MTTKLNLRQIPDLPEGGNQQQTDYAQVDESAIDFIKNKPDLTRYYLANNPLGFITPNYTGFDTRYKVSSYNPTWDEIINKPTNVSYFENDSGYLTKNISDTYYQALLGYVAADDNNVIHKTLDETKNGSLTLTGTLTTNVLSLTGNTPENIGTLSYFNQRFLLNKTLEVYQGIKYGGGNDGILINNLSISRMTNNGNTVDYGVFHNDLSSVAFSGNYNDLTNKPVGLIYPYKEISCSEANGCTYNVLLTDYYLDCIAGINTLIFSNSPAGQTFVVQNRIDNEPVTIMTSSGWLINGQQQVTIPNNSSYTIYSTGNNYNIKY